MGSAFSNSPGGCCCTPGWYDLYDSRLIPSTRGNRIVRVPLIGQSDDPGHDSWTDTQWGIQPSRGTAEHGTILGMQTPGQEYIWSFEQYPPGVSSTNLDLVLYDAAHQTELIRFANVPYDLNFDPTAGGGQTGTGGGTLGSIGFARDGGIGHPATMGIVEFSLANGLSFKPCAPSSDPSIYHVYSIAPRGWPKCGGARIDSSHTGYAAIGDVTADGARNLTLSGASLIKTVPDCSSIGLTLDYFNGHWTSLLTYTIRSTGKQFQSLWIDGSQIVEYQQPTGQPTTYFNIPHVCFPRAGSASDSYVVVPTVLWDFLPTSGVTINNPQGNGRWHDQTYQMVFVVYKNGTEVWRSARCSLNSICDRSSDKWLFLRTGATGDQVHSFPGSSQLEFTNGLYGDGAGGTIGGNIIYMARHDGTQIVPAGRDNATPHSMGPAMTNQHLFGAAVVCNTSLIPNTAPADLAFLAT